MKLFVIGAASALAVVLVGWVGWMATADVEASPTVLAPQVSVEDFNALQRRVLILERELEGLQSAPVAIARVDRPRAGVTPWPAEDRSALDDGGGGAQEPGVAVVADDPEIREAVAGLVEEHIEIEREERQQRRLESMVKGIEQRVDAFAEANALTPEQKTKMSALLTQYTRTRMDMMREARQNGTFPETMDKVRGMLDETDEALSGVLSKEQFAVYKEEQKDAFDRRRRRP